VSRGREEVKKIEAVPSFVEKRSSDNKRGTEKQRGKLTRGRLKNRSDRNPLDV